ncbi:MAG: hypothetical protein CMM18_05330 [Rhodospirillaceae bacterium]|nr:hypothetical protein [Rhodospirillaceae bacterium]|tara:strand:- start:262 stop:753 length:492 start_codon:yes stop_codon:yes gene_type:complete
MSRLESAIRRLQSQKVCIEFASELISDLQGVILEIGLGNGRTYDHIKKIFPEKKVFVFEKSVKAHPDCIPPKKYLYEGDFKSTLFKFKKEVSAPIILAHFDIGSGNEDESLKRAESLSVILSKIIDVNGLVVGDQSLSSKFFTELQLPQGITIGRYFMYKLNV